jgi:hypothetical protein
MRPFFVVIVLYCCGASIGCKESAVSALPTGTWRGQLYLSDSVGGVFKDASGTTVELEGTIWHQVTDTGGYFTFRSIPTGTYVVRASRPGFAPLRATGQSFVGGGVQWLSLGILYPLVTLHVSIDSLVVNHSAGVPDSISSVMFKLRIPPRASLVRNRSIRILVSRTPTPDFNDIGSLVYYQDLAVSSDPGDITWQIAGTFLARYPHSSLYVLAIPFGTYDQYFDVQTGQEVWTNIGTLSNVLTLVMP